MAFAAFRFPQSPVPGSGACRLRAAVAGVRAVVLTLVAAAACIGLVGCGKRTPELLAEGRPVRSGFQGELRLEPREDLLVVPVRIGGREVDLLLDSGAPTAITPALRRELGLSARSSTRAEDVRGTRTEVDVVQLPEVSIAGVRFERIAAIVLDVGVVPELRCLGISGLLGANLMRQAVWQMDLGAGHLRFADRIEALGLADGARRVRFITADSGAPLIRPVIAGTPVPEMYLDTGASVGMVAPPAALPEGAAAGSIPAVGSSGAAALGYGPLSGRTRFALIDHIELGELRITDRIVEFREENSLMGTRFLRDYTITLNWPGREAFFAPKPGPRQPSPGGFGFRIQLRDGRIVASLVLVGSGAWEKGLRPGDPILAVDGTGTATITDEQYCRILEEGLVPASRETLPLTFRGASGERTIELERLEAVVW